MFKDLWEIKMMEFQYLSEHWSLLVAVLLFLAVWIFILRKE
jgi:cbb3-type cytochrome oxidase subunit 3